MWMLRKIRPQERAFLFRDGAYERMLTPGWQLVWAWNTRLERFSVRDPWIETGELAQVTRSGDLEGEALVLDVKDRQRALVWVDGRFETILRPGLWALWTTFRDVRAELVRLSEARFEHAELRTILAARVSQNELQTVQVETGFTGLVFEQGRLTGSLAPGLYAFWREADVKVRVVDGRQQRLDLQGQDIITADKVTLRLNAVITFRITDPERATAGVDALDQALYREAQLALRAVIGAWELDRILSAKDEVASELDGDVRRRAEGLGIEIDGLGIRDIILPGEMRTLLNRVTEARKAAEANLISRREETAAMRSQANTARLLEANPTLMRLRELEVLEKVAETSQLQVILGENGLTDRLTKLI